MKQSEKQSEWDRHRWAGPMPARWVTEKLFDDNWEEIEAYAIANHTPYSGIFPIEDALGYAVDTILFDMNYGGLTINNQSAEDLLETFKICICEYANEYAGQYSKNL